MKFLVVTTAAMLAATSAAQALEIGSTGISVGAELDAYYDVDKESTQMTLTPELGYSYGNILFSLETELDVISNDTLQFEEMFDDPVLTFETEYHLWGPNAKLYGETNWDIDERDLSDGQVGVKFKF